MTQPPPPDAALSADAGRGVLVTIRAALPSLRPAERRVAVAVLGDPAGVAGRSIGTLAAQCSTSGATVLRFCHAIGYRHYPDLRLALARETGREEAHNGPGAHLTGDISPTDSIEQIVATIAYSDARAIEDTAATLDLGALARAIDAVARAERVDIYGIGASGFVAQDLHQKLHRMVCSHPFGPIRTQHSLRPPCWGPAMLPSRSRIRGRRWTRSRHCALPPNATPRPSRSPTSAARRSRSTLDTSSPRPPARPRSGRERWPAGLRNSRSSTACSSALPSERTSERCERWNGPMPSCRTGAHPAGRRGAATGRTRLRSGVDGMSPGSEFRDSAVSASAS